MGERVLSHSSVYILYSSSSLSSHCLRFIICPCARLCLAKSLYDRPPCSKRSPAGNPKQLLGEPRTPHPPPPTPHVQPRCSSPFPPGSSIPGQHNSVCWVSLSPLGAWIPRPPNSQDREEVVRGRGGSWCCRSGRKKVLVLKDLKHFWKGIFDT